MYRALLLCLLLAGCGPFGAAVGALAGAELATLPILHRGAGDAIYSAVTGRDCSVVRLEQGDGFCVPREGPITAPAFCTPSLARADCWDRPDLLPGAPRGLADAPMPTPAQLADRTRRWPSL